MAQKALKVLAAKNTKTLNRAHLISLGVHGFFLLLSSLFFTRSRLAWFLISLPSLLIEFWFEKIARPTFVDVGGAKELKRAGEDLDAQGLTEYMWDVVYFTWGTVVLAALFGNWVWYLYAVVPAWSIWLAYSTFMGAKAGFGGLAGGSSDEVPTGAQSKRQAKMEKRGGQKVQYR